MGKIFILENNDECITLLKAMLPVKKIECPLIYRSIPELEQAIRQSDFEKIHIKSHHIKGSCGNPGQKKLLEQFDLIEKDSLGEKDLKKINDFFLVAKEYFAPTVKLLKNQL